MFVMNMKKKILLVVLVGSMLMVLGGCSVLDEISKGNIEKSEDKTGNDSGIEEKKDIEIEDEEKLETDDNKLEEKKLNAKMFIANGSYEVTYDGSDLLSSKNYIKGDGAAYQNIGINGKGPFVDVYTIKDFSLYRSFSSDLTEKEFIDKENLDYLGEKDDVKENILLKEPIEVGSRWDNKEIVEVGENLKLDSMTLEGTYVKVWEKEKSDEGNEIVQVHYYSEGLGCVEYRILVDGIVMEHSKLKSVTKK